MDVADVGSSFLHKIIFPLETLLYNNSFLFAILCTKFLGVISKMPFVKGMKGPFRYITPSHRGMLYFSKASISVSTARFSLEN